MRCVVLPEYKVPVVVTPTNQLTFRLELGREEQVIVDGKVNVNEVDDEVLTDSIFL